MIYTFDGQAKVITLGAGSILDVRDLYSRWKDWVADGNSQFPFAFAVVGGEPIDITEGIFVTGYFFLSNGWRVRPNENSYKLKVKNGILLVDDGSDPFVQTIGTYNVLIQYSQPVKSETVATGGGGGGSYTPEEISDAVWQGSVPINPTPGTWADLFKNKMLTVAKFIGLR